MCSASTPTVPPAWRGDTVDSRWARTRRSAGVTGVRLHDLRHWQATQLLDAGVPVPTVAARLGHADGTTTMKIYAHRTVRGDEMAAEVVGAALGCGRSKVELTMSSTPRRRQAGRGYAVAVVRRAGDLHDDPAIEIVNPDEDTSPEAVAAWLAELDAADDWIDLPVTAAELLAEDRADAGS